VKYCGITILGYTIITIYEVPTGAALFSAAVQKTSQRSSSEHRHDAAAASLNVHLVYLANSGLLLAFNRG